MTAWCWRSISALLLICVAVARASDAAAVFVIANARVPESVAIAREYMALRGVPESQYMAIGFSDATAISHREFERNVRSPLRKRFADEGWLATEEAPVLRGRARGRETVVRGSRIRYLLSTWGVPYRIKDSQGRVVRRLERWEEGADKRDAAALDSELTLLLFDEYSREGAIANPRFNRPTSEGAPILATARLDGPTTAIVRERLRETLDAERRGLLGMALIDAKGGDNDLDRAGDAWLQRASLFLDRLGMPLLFDNRPALVPEGTPVPPGQLAVYLGWYASDPEGFFATDKRLFAPGGIGLHLHSLAGHAPRESGRHWVGSLIAQGAAATYGCVNEPYLGGVPRFDLFIERLRAGRTYAEAVLEASPQLSWQTVIVGDPLYRPFAADAVTQAAQVPSDDPFSIYLRLRECLAVAQRYPDAALARARQHPEPLARELEGLLLFALGREGEGKALLADLARNASDPSAAVRAAFRLSERDPAQHGELAETLRQRFGDTHPSVRWFIGQTP